MPEPCLGASSCPVGRECLASRCVLEGSTPVDSDTDRVLLVPVGLAVAGDDTERGLAPSVTLGNPSTSPRALYVRFARPPEARSIRAAFLLLEQSAGALVGADVELEIRRTDQTWTGSGFPWSKRPRTSAPSARAIARSVPPSPVRVDVTELVRSAARSDEPIGFAIFAPQASSAGVTLDTGLGGGSPPRLDVYFTTPNP